MMVSLNEDGGRRNRTGINDRQVWHAEGHRYLFQDVGVKKMVTRFSVARLFEKGTE